MPVTGCWLHRTICFPSAWARYCTLHATALQHLLWPHCSAAALHRIHIKISIAVPQCELQVEGLQGTVLHAYYG